MKRVIIPISLSLLVFCGPGYVSGRKADIYDWSDSRKQFECLSSLVLENPASPDLKEYTVLLVSLAPAVGRKAVLDLLDKALKNLEDAGAKGSASWLLLASAVIESGFPEHIKDSGTYLNRWLVTGTWKRYGGPDMDFVFQPETSADWKKIRQKRIYNQQNFEHSKKILKNEKN